MPHIAILTFEGYNELDSLIALGVLNRIKTDDWRVTIATPGPKVTSMNGVVIEQMSTLEEACAADAVIVGSGIATREVVEDPAIMNVLRRLDPSRRLIAAQCSGALVLARLGLLGGIPACTDLTTKPWVVAAGVEVLNQPFYAKDNIATMRRLPGLALPRRLDHRPSAGQGGRRRRAALCRPGRREGGVHGARLAQHRPVPARSHPGARLNDRWSPHRFLMPAVLPRIPPGR